MSTVDLRVLLHIVSLS